MSFYTDHKQVIDQAAHVAAGFAVGMLLHHIMPAIVALVIDCHADAWLGR